MKAIGRTLSVFAAVAAGFALPAFNSASAAGIPYGLQAGPAPTGQAAFEHCGCDNKQGIEMYVQNLINDAQQRGLTCGVSMHIPACITSYCSICGDHPELMASCVKTGMDYLASTPGFCSQQPTHLTAAYMPMMPVGWF